LAEQQRIAQEKRDLCLTYGNPEACAVYQTMLLEQQRQQQSINQLQRSLCYMEGDPQRQAICFNAAGVPMPIPPKASFTCTTFGNITQCQ
jgi:hypothetical protein